MENSLEKAKQTLQNSTKNGNIVENRLNNNLRDIGIMQKHFDKTSMGKDIKAEMILEIKNDIQKKKKNLVDLRLNVLAEDIYEIVLLKTKENITMENINTYIVLKNLVRRYDSNLKTIPLDFDLDYQLFNEIIWKYIEKIVSHYL